MLNHGISRLMGSSSARPLVALVFLSNILRTFFLATLPHLYYSS